MSKFTEEEFRGIGRFLEEAATIIFVTGETPIRIHKMINNLNINILIEDLDEKK